MVITKYEHACMVIDQGGKKLIIDPGQFSKSFIVTDDIAAVVVTHIHRDHFDPEKLRHIKTQNPSVRILSVQEVADAAHDLRIEVVTPGEGISIEPFHLEFCGGEHAVIHPSRPINQNVGVIVNETLYYPGDSFAMPHMPVKVLALPAAAPWLKISEPMDFLANVKAELNFPTHDAILSNEGKQVHDSMLQMAAEQAGVAYQRLKTGEELVI